MRRVAIALLASAAFSVTVDADAFAAFPGQNGKIAYDRYDAETDDTFICSVTVGGSPQCPVPGTLPLSVAPAWSASGSKLAFIGGGVWSVNSDGSGTTQITTDSADNPSWSPTGDRLAYARVDCAPACIGEIYAVNADGSGETQLTSDPADDNYPAFSPDGFRIAWQRGFSIWTMRADGTEKLNIGSGATPSWSPNGEKIAFESGGIWIMNPDGTNRTQLTTGSDYAPAWSPDGTKIAFRRLNFAAPTEGISVVDVSSGTVTPVVTESGFVAVIDRPDWQPLPVNTPSTFARPKSATKIHAALVPAHAACTSPNRQHGGSLAHPSCDPPTHLSPTLTVGVGDGSPAFSRSVGSVIVKAIISSDTSAPPDEADMSIATSITNVMRKADLSDYTGEVGVELSLQLTDREGPLAQTTVDFGLSSTVPCVATASTIDGANCALNTTVEALIPAAITEGRRSIFALGPVKVRDGGSDEDADTPAGDGTLAIQGVFVP